MVSASLPANYPHLTMEKSFYAEIKVAPDRVRNSHHVRQGGAR